MTVNTGTGLEPFHQQLLELEAEVNTLCADLTPEQFAQRPPSGGWSVQECLDHLNVMGKLYLERLEPVIESAKASGERGKRPLRYGLLGGFFVRSQEPPVRFRLKSPEIFQPKVQAVQSALVPDERVLPTFLALQGRLRDLLTRADGLPLTKLTITSPVTKLLKLSVLEAFGGILGARTAALMAGPKGQTAG